MIFRRRLARVLSRLGTHILNLALAIVIGGEGIEVRKLVSD